MMDLIRFMMRWVTYVGTFTGHWEAGYWTFTGLYAAVALAATMHCMYIAGSVMVPALRIYLDSGSVMLALRRGVGQ